MSEAFNPEEMVWSFSAITGFQQCPMSFYLQRVEHIKGRGNGYSDYGEFCHSLLEKWAKKEIPSVALAETYKEEFDQAVISPFPFHSYKTKQDYFEKGLRYFESFTGFGDDWEVLSAEKKFLIDIRGFHFTGLADLVLKNTKDGKIKVIDHKSKSKKSMLKDYPIYRKQLYVYGEWVKQEFGVYPDYLSFNMFNEGYNIDEEFNPRFHEEAMDWVENGIKEIINEKEWKPNPDPFFCQFLCGKLDYCPAKEQILSGVKRRR